MGAIAEAIVAYAQPLIDGTDGSEDELNRALAIAQMCWNLALMPEGLRETAIDEFKPTLNMTDAEFAEFRQQFILPMIRRHCEMFPGLHARSGQRSNTFGVVPSPTKKFPRMGRNAPCACGSGRKYKLCCGARK
jgi:uncharacterized protein YecA (UPF0149 family)